VFIERDHVSPDGAFRFLVRMPDGDITMGFDGFAWHTHGDILAACSWGSPEDAAERFVADLISNKLTIAVARVSGAIRDIWITDDPTANLRHCPSDEVIDFRLWDGTKVEVGCSGMAISRAERRAERKERVVTVFGEALAAPVLDLLELIELAWHDCYGEITPSEPIIDDILLCSEGELAKLIQAARLAIQDRRDLIMSAQQKRSRGSTEPHDVRPPADHGSP
jgi:hypothetical protein